MRSPLPAILSDHLPDYAPGRIVVVPAEQWSLPERTERLGVPTVIPRYALELRTLRTTIDPDRIRWLAERVATRPLTARHVHLAMCNQVLHVVDGHHALAAHLITGADQIPVRLVRGLDEPA